MVRVLLRFVLLVAVVIAVAQAPASAASPISFGNRPTSIAGFENGELANSELINVAPDCIVHRSAAPSLALLLASARQRGVSISMNECYRSLAGQIAIAQQWTNAGNSACAAAPSKPASGPVKGTSIHGWGRAADFDLNGGFGSRGYNYLKQAGASYGWNHPGFAEPGGSACPEPWHWEWVGDGGTQGGDKIRADVVGFLPAADDAGYATVTGLGGINTRGSALNRGAADKLVLNWVMVGAAPTPDRGGYWMVGADGGIFSYGNAKFFGSTGSMKLNQPVVGMAATPSGNGYWMVAADGGVFAYGDAKFFGSTGSMKLNKPVVAMMPTPTGNGYWLIASDGGVFAFGDATFLGSTGGITLNQPVVAATAAPDGNGYTLTASDGGVFAYGTAKFHGSTGGNPPGQPVVSIARTTSGNGYWIVSANGDVYAYGDARHFGSA